MSRVLGISAFYHDSAAAILDDGEVVAAAQEERFTRKRHDAAFPRHALAYCLEEAGLSLDELDAVVFYDKPFLKFERLLETYYAFAPRGLRSSLSAMPVWIKVLLYWLTHGDPLSLKRADDTGRSYWIVHDHQFVPRDLERPW